MLEAGFSSSDFANSEPCRPDMLHRNTTIHHMLWAHRYHIVIKRRLGIRIVMIILLVILIQIAIMTMTIIVMIITSILTITTMNDL